MSPDALFWASIALKLALTALIVVTASVVVERAGPLIGALVVTLPVTMWPAYVFLSLDHDIEFLAQSATTSLAVNAASALFMLVYAALAQRRSLLASLVPAVACWIALALFARAFQWTLTAATMVNVLAYSFCLWRGVGFQRADIPRIRREWYEIPLRTALVCALMGAVLLASYVLGAVATGVLAAYPISTTSTMLILHSRLGGKPSAAVIANGLWGMLGITWGLLALAATVRAVGGAMGLAFALAAPIVWNASIWLVRRRFA